MKTYNELISFLTFEERFKYLMLNGKVSELTFGSKRYLNQCFYSSDFWKKEVRPYIIVRDKGLDLGIEGREIIGPVYIHHIEPLTDEDILNESPKLADPNNLICCSFNTHNAIHYGNENYIFLTKTERHPGDTCPWKKNVII